MAALGTAAIKSYADYEQLIGGVETLFKTSADVVTQYANNAYKTAGMSANQYMETVTSFSASLLQSLGGDTQAAADAADQAIIDMSDNANKMGTSIELIQNAYQGFAKQNYSMLDNLKLGYGGTASEMYRLLQDAVKLNEEFASTAKFSIDSKGHLEANFADITKAIHIVQKEMGIMDTTAKEASTTISGSMGMVKASFSNLLTGVADDSQDFDKLVNNFVDSVSVAAENILPRVEVAITGAGKLIEKLLPVIINRAPKIINNVLPKLVESGANMIRSVVSGLHRNLPEIITGAIAICNTLISAFLEMVPEVIEIGQRMLFNFVESFTRSIPEKLPLLLDFVQKFADGISEKVPLFIEKGFELLQKLVEGIVSALPILIQKVPKIITTFADIINDNFPTILLKGAEIIWNLIKGIISAIPTIIENIPQIVEAIVSVIQAFGWLNLGRNIINWFKDGILSMVSAVKNAGSTIFNNIHDAVYNLPSTLLGLGKRAIQSMANGIGGMLGTIKNAAVNIATGIVNAFSSLPRKMLSIGENIISGIWSGISSGWSWLVGKVRDLAGSLFDSAKEALGINSPSKKFKWLAQMCVAGWDEGSEGLLDVDPHVNRIRKSFSVMKMNGNGSVPVYGGGRGTINQIININQPLRSPDEMARAARLESRYWILKEA